MTDISDGFDSTARTTVGETFMGLFELVNADGTPANDRDKIGIQLIGGTEYAIDLEGPVGPRMVLSVTQPGVFLPGNALSVGGRARLDFTPAADGLFFVDVAGRAADTDGYALTVTAAPASVIVDIDDDAGRALPGTEAADRIEGLGGDDTLSGGAGDDTLLGGAGDDAISGGDGDDRIEGGTGADVMEGGAGSDTYLVDDRGDRAIEDPAEAGMDEVVTSVRHALGDGIEALTGTGGANLRLDGNGGDNAITGSTGNDVLVGLGGADTMTGGAGRDTFVIARPGGPDVTVTDFAEGDRIAVDDQLLGIGARGVDVRELTGAVLQDLLQSGIVGYSAQRGELSVDLDGDGTREVVADLGDGVRLGLDDVLLF